MTSRIITPTTREAAERLRTAALHRQRAPLARAWAKERSVEPAAHLLQRVANFKDGWDDEGGKYPWDTACDGCGYIDCACPSPDEEGRKGFCAPINEPPPAEAPKPREALRYACGSEVMLGDRARHCAGPSGSVAALGNKWGADHVDIVWHDGFMNGQRMSAALCNLTLLSRAEPAPKPEGVGTLPRGWREVRRFADRTVDFEHVDGAHAWGPFNSLPQSERWSWARGRTKEGGAPTMLQAMCAALGIELKRHMDHYFAVRTRDRYVLHEGGDISRRVHAQALARHFEMEHGR